MHLAAVVLSGVMAVTNWQPPPDVNGWKLEGPPQHVTADNIFAYMNGAGELYLAYAFKSLDVWKFKRPGDDGEGILLEIYDMTRPEEAFGVLSQDLDGPDGGTGDRSVYAAGLLRFCEGRYFVRVLADVETDASKAAVFALAESFVKSVDEPASIPELVELLPREGLKPESVHFFHSKLVLDYLYYLAEDNILELSRDTDAVLADYSAGGDKARLMVIEYPDEKTARRGWEQFNRVYLEQPHRAGEGVTSKRLEDDKWVSVVPADNRLVIAFEAKTKTAGEDLIRKVLDSLEE